METLKTIILAAACQRVNWGEPHEKGSESRDDEAMEKNVEHGDANDNAGVIFTQMWQQKST